MIQEEISRKRPRWVLECERQHSDDMDGTLTEIQEQLAKVTELASALSTKVSSLQTFRRTLQAGHKQFASGKQLVFGNSDHAFELLGDEETGDFYPGDVQTSREVQVAVPVDVKIGCDGEILKVNPARDWDEDLPIEGEWVWAVGEFDAAEKALVSDPGAVKVKYEGDWDDAWTTGTVEVNLFVVTPKVQ